MTIAAENSCALPEVREHHRNAMNITELKAAESAAVAEWYAAREAIDAMPDDLPDDEYEPARQRIANADVAMCAAKAAVFAAMPAPTAAQQAAAAEQAEASQAQLEARQRIAARDAVTPAFPLRCQCGGMHGVSADKKSCNDCR